jgi:hypothetical protein
MMTHMPAKKIVILFRAVLMADSVGGFISSVGRTTDGNGTEILQQVLG